MTDGKGTAAQTAPRHQNTNTDKDAGKRHFTNGEGAGEDIQHRQAGSGDDRIDAVELTRRLGFTAGEHISLSWKRPGDSPWRYQVVGYDPHRLANHVATAGAGFNHYFLINPVRSDTAKRGRADEITRLADLPVEIDGYKNGHATVETVCGFAIELSQKIGAAPVGIVESGGGWHLHWAVAGGEIGEDFPVPAAKQLLLCWRALAGLVAGHHGITLDPIFDLARVLRLPGTVNPKYRPPRPVVAHDLPGGPIALPELRQTLHEYLPPPRPPRPRRAVTAVTGYPGVPGDRGHPYYRHAEAGLLAEFGSTGPGGRNDALNATTYKLARIALACGVPPARAGAVMVRAAQAAGLDTDDNCGADGIGHTVSSALRAAERDGAWPIGCRRRNRT